MADPTSVTLKVLADVKDAKKSVESLTNTVQLAFGAIAGFFAGRKLVGAFNTMVAEASAAESALTRLEVALKLSGDFSAQASAQFQEFAAQLQASSTFADDVILKNLALAKSFNVTNDRAKALVGAAANLAAVTGTSLDDAVSNLGKTLDGTAGRLAEQIPGIKDFSAAQLQAGAAIDYVASRFRGGALAASQTFEGSIIRVKNNFSDLQEVLGGYVTQNTVVRKAIEKLGDLFVTLQGVLKNNESTVLEFVKQITVGVIRSVELLIRFVAGLDIAFSKIIESFTAVYRFFKAIPDLIAATVDSIKSFDATPLRKLNDELNRQTFESQKPLLDRLSIYDDLTRAVGKYGDEVQKVESKQLVAAKKASDVIENQAKAQSKLNQNQVNLFNQGLTNLGQGAKGLGGAVSGVAQNLTQGIAESLGTIGAQLAPGIGAVAGQLAGVLAQGPEATRQFIDGIIKGIPEIINNIILSIPVLIQSIVDGLPELLEKVAIGLAENMPTVAAKLAAQGPFIGLKIATGIISHLPMIMKEFSKEMLKIPGQFVEELLKALGDSIPGGKALGGIAGGVGDIAGDIGKAGFIGGAIAGPVGGAVGGAIGAIGDVFGFRSANPDALEIAGRRAGSQGSGAGEGSNLEQKITALQSAIEKSSEKNLSVKLVVGERELAGTILNLNRQGFRLA